MPRHSAPHFTVALVVVMSLSTAVRPAQAQDAAVLAEIDRGMEHYRLDAHIPGMGGGVVKDGRLVHVKGAWVQDIEAKRPVTAETLFRIASMTKAFTALSVLKLRDDGKLVLDAPAETYVPEMKGWQHADRGLAQASASASCSPTPPAWSPTTRGATVRPRCPRMTSRVCCATACPSPGRPPPRWRTRISVTRCSAGLSRTSRSNLPHFVQLTLLPRSG